MEDGIVNINNYLFDDEIKDATSAKAIVEKDSTTTKPIEKKRKRKFYFAQTRYL